MLETAMRLMQSGIVPSVSDVAEAAEVSRATAYRYFPSQAAMLQAVVDEALGPVLGWSSASEDAAERVRELFSFSYPRMLEYEATHRAALSLALDQWVRRQAGGADGEERIVRGNRKMLLGKAVGPLRGRMGPRTFDKLTQSLSLLFGIEAIIVLKDIWGLEGDDARRVAMWAAQALVQTALNEAGSVTEISPAAKPRPTGRGRDRKATSPA